MRFRFETMNKLVFALLVLIWSASPSWAAGLKLSMQAGLVSLDAQDVTVRQILAEWARIGQTRIINAERVTGGPVTLKFDDIPEKQALDIVLRSVPGYMALPRAMQVADASLYDRILIMATTTAVAAARPQSPAAGFTAQPMPGFPGLYSGAQAGAAMTQLRPTPPAPLSPGILPEPMNSADDLDDPAIAAAAAAGLVPIPAFNPGPSPTSAPLMPPSGAGQAPSPPGVGAPTNPWNIPVGTAQPGVTPPTPAPNVQAPPPSRVRPPQADR
jgi:hypothetical protein